MIRLQGVIGLALHHRVSQSLSKTSGRSYKLLSSSQYIPPFHFLLSANSCDFNTAAVLLQRTAQEAVDVGGADPGRGLMSGTLVGVYQKRRATK